jgi:Raf kinase inhibitor-like YbhB/YbcL family protein
MIKSAIWVIAGTAFLGNVAAAKENGMKLSSSAFSHQQSIPQKYTCDGDDLSPPLEWADVPAGTQSLALIADDPDAPDPAAPKMVYVHWVVYNIPPGTTGLAENASPAGLPKGAHEGKNDFKKVGYGGPCPPIGKHRYFFKLYALDTALDLKKPTKSDVEKAMHGHILAQAELMGTFGPR